MKTLLFHSRDTAELAADIASRDDRIQPWTIHWDLFPNGMPDTQIENPFDIRDQVGAFLASFDSLADMTEQWMCIGALMRMGLSRLTLILPYYPVSTMERIDPNKPGQVVTAKSLATLLSAIPVAKGQSAKLVTYDLHASQEVFYFGPDLPVRDKTAVKYIRREIDKTPNSVIVFPDYGAFNRFKGFFNGYDFVICNKERLPGAERKVVIAGGAHLVKGKHCIIFDDIIMLGGTLISCADELLANGAAQVSAACVHPDCPQDSWKKFTDGKFANVFVCDTVPRTIRAVRGVKPFRIVTLADSIKRVIVKDDDKNL